MPQVGLFLCPQIGNIRCLIVQVVTYLHIFKIILLKRELAAWDVALKKETWKRSSSVVRHRV